MPPKKRKTEGGATVALSEDVNIELLWPVAQGPAAPMCGNPTCRKPLNPEVAPVCWLCGPKTPFCKGCLAVFPIDLVDFIDPEMLLPGVCPQHEATFHELEDQAAQPHILTRSEVVLRDMARKLHCGYRRVLHANDDGSWDDEVAGAAVNLFWKVRQWRIAQYGSH